MAPHPRPSAPAQSANPAAAQDLPKQCEPPKRRTSPPTQRPRPVDGRSFDLPPIAPDATHGQPYPSRLIVKHKLHSASALARSILHPPPPHLSFPAHHLSFSNALRPRALSQRSPDGHALPRGSIQNLPHFAHG